jgi:hypothetical protein
VRRVGPAGRIRPLRFVAPGERLVEEVQPGGRLGTLRGARLRDTAGDTAGDTVWYAGLPRSLTEGIGHDITDYGKPPDHHKGPRIPTQGVGTRRPPLDQPVEVVFSGLPPAGPG